MGAFEELGILTVPIVPDQAGLDRGLRAARGSLIGFAGVATGIFQGMGQSIFGTLTSALTLPFRMFGQTIRDAADAEGIQLKFKSVFKEMSADAEAWSKNFSANIGRGTTEVKNILSRFQDTLVPIGFDRGTATDTSKKLTRLSVDLAAAEQIGQAEAADRIVSGMVGNHEALRRFGVIITETSLNAQLLAMGIKGGSKAATEQQKVIARLNMVLLGTRDAQGAAGRAAGSFSQESMALGGVLTGLSATVGKIFTPALSEVTKFFRGIATELTASMGDTDDIGKSFGAAVGDMLKKFEGFKDNLIKYFGEVKEALLSLLGFFTDNIGNMNLADFLMQVPGELLAAAENLGQIIGHAIAKEMVKYVNAAGSEYQTHLASGVRAEYADLIDGIFKGAPSGAAASLMGFKPGEAIMNMIFGKAPSEMSPPIDRPGAAPAGEPKTPAQEELGPKLDAAQPESPEAKAIREDTEYIKVMEQQIADMRASIVGIGTDRMLNPTGLEDADLEQLQSNIAGNQWIIEKSRENIERNRAKLPPPPAGEGDPYGLIDKNAGPKRNNEALAKGFKEALPSLGKAIGAGLEGLGAMAGRRNANLAIADGMNAPRPARFDFMGTSSVQNAIQAALGGDDAKRRDVERNNKLDAVSENTDKTVKELTTLAENVGKSIAKFIGFAD